MGRRPSPQHTLERVNVHGNYERENCTWLLAKLQCRNQTKTMLTEEGAELVRQWLAEGHSQQVIADLLHVHQGTISEIKCGNTWRTDEEGPTEA